MAFVGRAFELSILQEAYAEVAGGAGRSIAIVGEAGIGKTGLLEHFLAALGDGATTLRGYSADIDGEPPYAPWSRALAPVREMIFDEALRQHFGASAAVLRNWLSPSRAGVAPTPTLSAQDERLLLWDGIVTLLELVASKRPVLLVIEDIHWSDGDSLRLLRHVAEAVPRMRLLLVVSARDDASEAVKTLPTLMRGSNLQRLAIRGFNLEETRELLFADGSHIPSFLVSALHEETRGNVFFLRELWRHLVEEGRVLKGEGSWASNFSVARLGLPASIYELVASRLSRLDETTLRVMRDGSFFRSGFRLLDLETVGVGDSVSVLAALEQAIASGLVMAPSEAGGAYHFSHAIVRRTLYEAINPDRRALTHRRLAEALASGAVDSSDSAGEIAAQYGASVTLPGASAGIPFALTAARLAKQNAAYDGAVRLLRLALTLLPTREQREQILRELVTAEASALMFSDATATVSLSLAEGADVPEFCALATRALKEAGASRSHWEPLVARGLGACRVKSLTWARLRLLCDNVEPVVQGSVNVSRWIGRDAEAIEVARRDGDELDWARTIEPYDPRDLTQTREAHALVRQWKQPLAVMRGLDVVGRDLVYRQANFEEATVCLEELVQVAQRCGSLSGQAEALCQLGYCYLALGRLTDSNAAHQSAARLAARLGPEHRVHVVNLAVTNMASYLTGDRTQIAAAAAGLRKASAAPETGRGPLGLTLAGHAVLASALAGEAHAALELLPLLMCGIEATPEHEYLRPVAIGMATTACYELGERSLASRLVVLNEALDRKRIPDPMGSRLLLLARAYVLDGNSPAALDAYARSAAEAGGLERHGVAAIADYERALLLSETQQVEAELSDVQQRFEKLGFLGRAAQVRGLLEARPKPSSFAELTSRELEILLFVARGATNKEIAKALFISLPTVQRHVANIYAKTNCRNRSDATAFAIRRGLLRV